MNQLRSVAALAFACALTLTASAPIARATKAFTAPPGVGKQAPEFTLLDQNRQKISLSAGRGQKVVLVFYRGYW